MAIKSPLNPGTIVNEKSVSIDAAKNFITGGAPLGGGVLAGAANKIVGFQRGASSVSPKTPDLGSIINTLSNSILNNVENRLQSVNKNVVNVVNNSLQKITKDYSNKISQLDAQQPNNILKNFLSLYKDAIDFLQFLGNRRNVKTLGDNLNALRRIFEETFNVAKIIRQTIIKIVDQLSNLPTSSGGGGGLNLDIKIPGSNVLKQTAPRGFAKNLTKFALGGAALAGIGGLGSQAINGMMDTEDNVNPVESDKGGGLSGPILDKFTGILDKFAEAIANFKPGKSPQEPPPTSKSGSGSPAPPPPGPGAGKAGTPPDLSSSGKQGVMEYAKAKGFSNEFTAGLLTNVSAESGGNPFAYNPDDSGAPSYGAFQFRAERGDSMIKYLESNGIPNAKSIFTNPNDPRRKDKKLEQKALSLQIQYFTEDEKDSGTPGLKAAQKSTSLEEVHKAFAKSERYAGSNDPNSARYKARKRDTELTLKELQKQGGINPSPTPNKVVAASTQSTTAQQVSQTVAQQPGSNQPAQPVILPLNTESVKQKPETKPSTATVTSTPVMNNKGTNVPNIGSSNENNFLTLYSKLVYNIVDG